MIKAQTDPSKLKHIIEKVLQGKRYFSKDVKNYIQSTYNGVTIDEFDRQILYHLAMGEKTKDICKYISLSHRAIEARKAKLKSLLKIDNNSHFNLVKSAKKLGII